MTFRFADFKNLYVRLTDSVVIGPVAESDLDDLFDMIEEDVPNYCDSGVVFVNPQLGDTIVSLNDYVNKRKSLIPSTNLIYINFKAKRKSR